MCPLELIREDFVAALVALEDEVCQAIPLFPGYWLTFEDLLAQWALFRDVTLNAIFAEVTFAIQTTETLLFRAEFDDVPAYAAFEIFYSLKAPRIRFCTMI